MLVLSQDILGTTRLGFLGEGNTMAATQNWKAFLANWPDSLPRRGVLVSNLNESMPFRNFYIKEGMVMLERTTPDAMGARFVLLDFEMINSVKIIDPLNTEHLKKAGFIEKPAIKEPQLV